MEAVMADAVPVESLDVELGDAHVALTVDGEVFRLEPAQVHFLVRQLTAASNDLHIHSNA